MSVWDSELLCLQQLWDRGNSKIIKEADREGNDEKNRLSSGRGATDPSPRPDIFFAKGKTLKLFLHLLLTEREAEKIERDLTSEAAGGFSDFTCSTVGPGIFIHVKSKENSDVLGRSV